MKTETTIFILLACYSLMFVTIVGFERLRAGNSLSRSDLRVLNYFHVALISQMLATSCIIRGGYFLMQFPDKINVEQLAAFLMVFGIISFLPWKKFSKEVTVGQYISGQPVSRIALYTLLRTGFIVIYEWFFRGLLLLSFYDSLGTAWAIVVNVFLYAMLHVHKSKKEMFGSVPLGVIMCAFTLWWQSIWPAIIFHVQLVIVNEWPLLQKSVSFQKQNAI